MLRKIYLSFLMTLMLVIILSTCVYAANEKLSIVKNETGEYLIYIQNHEDTEFEFAFSNEKNAGKESLTYRLFVYDSIENKVAYINESVLSTGLLLEPAKVYLWAREINTGEYIVNGVEVDLKEKMDAKKVEEISHLTQRILVHINYEVTKDEMVYDKNVKLVQDKIIIDSALKTYEYQINKLSKDSRYNNLVDIANVIWKFNSYTKTTTKLQAYKAFYDEYQSLVPEMEDRSWKEAENNEIFIPENTEEGDIYVVWLKDLSTDKIDLQIMTSKKDYLEDLLRERTEYGSKTIYKQEVVVREKLESLPVTGDDYVLFIVLAVLVLITILAAILKSKIKIFSKILIVLVIGIIIVVVLIAIKYGNMYLNDWKVKDIVTNIDDEMKDKGIISKVKRDDGTEENIVNKINSQIEGHNVIGIIRIPKIKLEYPILETTSEHTLKLSVTKFFGDKLNETGNVVITGHNYNNTTMFSKLNKLEIGDIVKITDEQNMTLDYKISKKYKVKPTDMSIVEATEEGAREITLLTCTNGRKERLIIKAIEII